MHRGNSRHTVKALAQRVASGAEAGCGLWFLDGAHSRLFARDMENAMAAAAPGAVFMVDDVSQDDVTQVLARRSLTTVALPHTLTLSPRSAQPHEPNQFLYSPMYPNRCGWYSIIICLPMFVPMSIYTFSAPAHSGGPSSAWSLLSLLVYG